jgi:hypothetical protein
MIKERICASIAAVKERDNRPGRQPGEATEITLAPKVLALGAADDALA